ncbi:GntR family transcriptional regulator, partial [Streptomyces microflavus]
MLHHLGVQQPRQLGVGRAQRGSVLRTDELAQRFDVSRTVVREVVRVLESM